MTHNRFIRPGQIAVASTAAENEKGKTNRNGKYISKENGLKGQQLIAQGIALGNSIGESFALKGQKPKMSKAVKINIIPDNQMLLPL